MASRINVFLILTLLVTTVMTSHCSREHAERDGCNQRDIAHREEKPGGVCWWKVGAGVVGGVVAIVAAPVVLTAAGFTAGGIAAGSLAASAMSASGTVAAGGVIAGLQSAGAAGLGTAATIVTGAAGGAAGYTVGSYTADEDCGK